MRNAQWVSRPVRLPRESLLLRGVSEEFRYPAASDPEPALVPTLRRRSSARSGAEPRHRPGGSRMTKNGRGPEPHGRIGSDPQGGGRQRPVRTEPSSCSLRGQADQTKAQRLGLARGGRNGTLRKRTRSRLLPQAARRPRLIPTTPVPHLAG